MPHRVCWLMGMHKAILLDLGRVLIDFDFGRGYRALEGSCPYTAEGPAVAREARSPGAVCRRRALLGSRAGPPGAVSGSRAGPPGALCRRRALLGSRAGPPGAVAGPNVSLTRQPSHPAPALPGLPGLGR